MAETTKQQAQQMHNEWKSMMEQQTERMGAFYQEVAKVERQSVEQAHKNLDEANRLFKASFDYATQLSEEWRKASLEATRRTMSLMVNPWSMGA